VAIKNVLAHVLKASLSNVCLGDETVTSLGCAHTSGPQAASISESRRRMCPKMSSHGLNGWQEVLVASGEQACHACLRGERTAQYETTTWDMEGMLLTMASL
jgi:hypothetical protein